MPRRFAERRIAPFVEERRPWIERTLERLRTAEAELGTAELCDGGWVPYLGRRYALDVIVEPGRTRPRVAVRDAPPAAERSLRVFIGRGGRNPLRDALERWYRRRARAEIAPRLDAATARAGTGYRRLQIRGQRTRWASCSNSGAMSFNWRLLLAPAEILDYVVEHEVAHLHVPDHSDRFWALLSERVPDYRDHERWLRRNGHALRL